jgi:hypothetical protein
VGSAGRDWKSITKFLCETIHREPSILTISKPSVLDAMLVKLALKPVMTAIWTATNGVGVNL